MFKKRFSSNSKSMFKKIEILNLKISPCINFFSCTVQLQDRHEICSPSDQNIIEFVYMRFQIKGLR